MVSSLLVVKNYKQHFLFLSFICLYSCKSWQPDRFEELRTYETNYGSRIELYLELSRKELIDNYERKKLLMVRENQPRAVVHPRKDVTLREIINSAHEENKITVQQKTKYLDQCDDLLELWEKHWHLADQKARRLRFKP